MTEPYVPAVILTEAKAAEAVCVCVLPVLRSLTHSPLNVGVRCLAVAMLQVDVDSSEDEGEMAAKNKHSSPGDYPGADDVDSVEEVKLWTKIGGGAMAETGLAAPRLLKAEDGSAAPAVDTAAEASTPAAEGDAGASLSTSSGVAPSPSVAAKLTSPSGVALRSGTPSVPLQPVTRSPQMRRGGTNG
jgi:hypothetical protein